MISLRRLLAPLAMALAASSIGDAAATADGLRDAKPTACVPRVEDFALMWWADGFPGRSPGIRPLQRIQTGQYAMDMDVARMQLTHLGLAPRSLSYAEAGLADDRLFAGLGHAELELTITIDGHSYRCVRGGPFESHSGPRPGDFRAVPSTSG